MKRKRQQQEERINNTNATSGNSSKKDKNNDSDVLRKNGKLSNVPPEVLDKLHLLSIDLLAAIGEKCNAEFIVGESKEKFIDRIKIKLESRGAKIFLKKLSKPHLYDIAKSSIPTKYGCGELLVVNRSTIETDLQRAIEAKGLIIFLTSYVSEVDLFIIERLCTDDDDLGKSPLCYLPDRIEAIYEYIINSVYNSLLNELSQCSLVEILRVTNPKEYNLCYNVHSLAMNKSDLVDLLMKKKKFTEIQKAKKQKILEHSRKRQKTGFIGPYSDKGTRRLEIQPGGHITYEHLMQRYYLSELRDYCRSRALHQSGKKSTLAKRIIAYLATPAEPYTTTTIGVIKKM